ncbi:MAG: ABC transporter ATP-binding protein [Chloroflexi bacterium]|nr:ABC transporter ATP-binding protein [Chloroflexota bacterium]
MASKISIKGVTQRFNSQGSVFTALEDANLDIATGEFVALIGPSGCGKSTLLNIVAGLISPSGGTVLIEGEDYNGRRHPQIGYVFQQDTVLPWRRVYDNVLLGLEYRDVPKSERPAKAARFLSMAGLQGFENYYPYQLSGGMRRRLALVMTLVVEPSVLLMDEPFGALDAFTKMFIHNELLQIWDQFRQTILFVTHDLSEALTLSDRVIIMGTRPGRILAEYQVKLPRPRNVIRLREDESFLRQSREVWDLLASELERQDLLFLKG